ncbi:MAG: flavodoxin domain-containing protein [Armatimonadota bacterium]
MNALVAYESRYGSTQQYAEWIADEAGVDVRPVDELDIEALDGYDTIVFGGWIHAGKLRGADFIQKHWDVLQGKCVAVFSVSGKPPESDDVQKALENALPEPICDEVECFSIPGRLIYNNLRLVDRLLVTVAGRRGVEFDGVEKSNIIPIVQFLRRDSCG